MSATTLLTVYYGAILLLSTALHKDFNYILPIVYPVALTFALAPLAQWLYLHCWPRLVTATSLGPYQVVEMVAVIHNARSARRALDLDFNNEPVEAWLPSIGIKIPVIDHIFMLIIRQEEWLIQNLPGYQRPIGTPIGIALSLVGNACYFTDYYPAIGLGFILCLTGASYNIRGVERTFKKESTTGFAINILSAAMGLIIMFLNMHALGTGFMGSLSAN